MKVLNRPMFRMGGPIKEGIMSGIKEPRQRYAEPPGFVVQSDPNKIILNRDVSQFFEIIFKFFYKTSSWFNRFFPLIFCS